LFGSIGDTIKTEGKVLGVKAHRYGKKNYIIKMAICNLVTNSTIYILSVFCYNLQTGKK
jgi:hypothetical protein